MKLNSGSGLILDAFVLLSLASGAVAHGNNKSMNMSLSDPSPPHTDSETYFRHGDRSAWMIAHISIMIISWVFILPIAVMLSISRSRYSRPVQIVFLVCNGTGIITAVVYNVNTPDLYPNNAHHKLSWLVTWVLVAQFILSFIYKLPKRKVNYDFTPISHEAIAEHQNSHGSRGETHRFSHDDSGHGTETSTNTQSRSSSSFSEDIQLLSHHQNPEEADEENEVSLERRAANWMPKFIPRAWSHRFSQFVGFMYNATDRLILFLSFAAISTGWITYGGLFKGTAVFSGLAHFIKGGVFFWFGILTLGRWAGCFAEIGWAWNVKSIRRYRPTAEFVESFLIFFYGFTNVFLEHLAAWGGEWTAKDIEHVSLTVMFFGGGLCGMLIESTTLRTILNVRISTPKLESYRESHEVQGQSSSYQNPMNPLPALIIIILGKMMGSHHQESMISTMLHSLWGNLLMAAAFARLATYLLLFLSPPKSILPGRPPTELLAAFGFMAGGLVFMCSANDVVGTIELYKLDAMFVFSVTVGVVTILMAWVLVVIGVKGWAVKRESEVDAVGFKA